MARCAIIEDGIVVNMAEATEEFAQEQGWIISDQAQIGWLYDGKKFSPPPATAEPAPEPTDVLAKIAAMEASLAELRAQIV